MYYRTLISALVFAAFAFCFSGEARAQSCDNPDFCFDWGFPSTIDNITGSSVTCDLEPGGASQPFNTLDIGTGGFNSNTGIFTQIGTATCKHLPDNDPLGTCDFELTWKNVSISSCANNSFTAGASCTDLSSFGGDLNVTGTVTCPGTPPKVMQLGIAGLTANQCNQVFPQIKQKNTVILPAGKVLDLSITTQGICTGPFVAISNVKERYCNDGFSGSGVDCTPIGGPTRTTTEGTTVNPSAVPFDFAVTQTVNTSPTFCKGGNAIDKGQAKVEIFGAPSFDVANINQSSLKCEGAPLICDAATDLNGDNILDLPCRVNTCPTFGPALGQLPRIAPGVVSATCTGQLNSKTQIVGIADVAVSPK